MHMNDERVQHFITNIQTHTDTVTHTKTHLYNYCEIEHFHTIAIFLVSTTQVKLERPFLHLHN